jgi:phage gp46-like protein
MTIQDFYTAQDNTGRFYVDLTGGNFAIDNTLRAAVIASLFTDRRLTAADPRPVHVDAEAAEYQGGYWGDDYPSDGGTPSTQARPHGSLLWVLRRAKEIEETRRLATIYIEQALRWLIDTGRATAITVDAWWHAPAMLGCAIDITLPDGSVWQTQFDSVTG